MKYLAILIKKRKHLFTHIENCSTNISNIPKSFSDPSDNNRYCLQENQTYTSSWKSQKRGRKKRFCDRDINQENWKTTAHLEELDRPEGFRSIPHKNRSSIAQLFLCTFHVLYFLNWHLKNLVAKFFNLFSHCVKTYRYTSFKDLFVNELKNHDINNVNLLTQ